MIKNLVLHFSFWLPLIIASSFLRTIILIFSWLRIISVSQCRFDILWLNPVQSV